MVTSNLGGNAKFDGGLCAFLHCCCCVMKCSEMWGVFPLNVTVQYAVLSGVAAASASVFGKLFSTVGGVTTSDLGLGALRALCLALMVTSNALVWTMFVRALRSSTSSLPATITSAAVNYCCSAIFGWLLFAERTSALWWSGSGLVLAGLLLINSSTSAPAPGAGAAPTVTPTPQPERARRKDD